MKTTEALDEMVKEFLRATPASYAKRERRLPPPARVQWFDGYENDIIPYEHEMAPQNRPLSIAITAAERSSLSNCFEYDSHDLPQAVRRSDLSPSRFVTLIERKAHTTTAFTFRVDGTPKPTRMSRVWLEGGRVVVAAQVTERHRTVWTYRYEGSLVSSIQAIKGTATVPVTSTVDYRFEFASDGTLVRIDGVSNGGAAWECYRRPSAETPRKLRSAFSSELGARVEDVARRFDHKGVVAVALAYASSPWEIPSLGVLLQSELTELPPRDVWNPAEWEHFETEALELKTSKLEELGRELRAHGDDALEETLVALSKKLTPRLEKVLTCGSFFACFPCNVSAPPRGRAVARFFSKSDQRVLAAKGLL